MTGPGERGRPDLFYEAVNVCALAGKPGTGNIIRDISAVMRISPDLRLQAIGNLAQTMTQFRNGLEPWLLTEIGAKSAAWVEELERALPAGDNALLLTRILPPFYETLRLPDAEARKQGLLERTIRLLLKNKRHTAALPILEGLAERKPERCSESSIRIPQPRRTSGWASFGQCSRKGRRISIA